MIINAQQARDRSKNIHSPIDAMVEIMSVISEACRKGQFHTNYFGPMSDARQSTLKDLGYSITSETPYTGTYYIISWD